MRMAHKCWRNAPIMTAVKENIFPTPVVTEIVPIVKNHENQQWIENQLAKRLPAEYYLITFTLPRQLRGLAWRYQKIVYSLMFDCVQG